MNIFFLSKDPVEAVKWHIDAHVRKMPIEAAQLLCLARYAENLNFNNWHNYVNYRGPYIKDNHYNHPCRKWINKSQSNWNWTLKYLRALLDEFCYRFQKKHAVEQVQLFLCNNPILIEDVGLTKPCLAMPEQYKDDDAITAYHKYYIMEKHKQKNGKRMDKWTKREKPQWYNFSDINFITESN